MTTHISEDDLTLYYYGDGRYGANQVPARQGVARHLESCQTCAATYREIAGTLALVAGPAVPERGEPYGLEVWQRIRHRLPEREASSWLGWREWFRADRLALAGAAAALVLTAFVAGWMWPRPGPETPAVDPRVAAENSARGGSDVRHRILLMDVADHLDRSERVLTDIMNASSRSDISLEQGWADDLLTASRLYRQDAADAGEASIAAVLEDLERSLIEIVHSPSPISAADLEQIRRRIDAAALLFKVRVMSEGLRQRDTGPAPRLSTGRTS